MERAILEFDGKKMLARQFPQYSTGKILPVSGASDFKNAIASNSWLSSDKLVVKPDMLFGKKAKNNLMLLNASASEVESFLKQNLQKTVSVNGISGKLERFLIEPFIKHDKEFYLALRQSIDGIELLYSAEGGVDIEDNWQSVKTAVVTPIESNLQEKHFKALQANDEIQKTFLANALTFFKEYGFSFLEFNPFTIINGNAVVLGFVGKVDTAISFLMADKWHGLAFPDAFGVVKSVEEKNVEELQSKTGASLKLKLLNAKGRIWTLNAGGGASIAFVDAIYENGLGSELGNYGEYSGDPSEEFTYNYAKNLISLMLKAKGRVLLVGGAIANFTDVSKTFNGIIRALRENSQELKKNNLLILVRRGGPNYKEGLKKMIEFSKESGIKINAFGPELPLTEIVEMARSELQ